MYVYVYIYTKNDYMYARMYTCTSLYVCIYMGVYKLSNRDYGEWASAIVSE